MSGSVPRIRPARSGDEPDAYHVCLKTGDHGQDGEPFYQEDPDALGRIYVGPYLAFEPDLSLILEDDQGMCGYALGAFDSRAFYARYEAEWRPDLCARFPAPEGDPPAGLACSRRITAITTRTISVPSPTRRILPTCTSTCCRAPRVAATAAACSSRSWIRLRDAVRPARTLA